MAFGAALQRDATAVVAAGGGRVVGDTKHAIGATDYSSQVLQAQAEGTDVVAFASVGGDLVNLIKQAHEFGLGNGGKPTLGGFLIYITDIHALGLGVAQGIELTSGFYWDQSDQSRAFAKRFEAELHKMPTKQQAAGLCRDAALLAGREAGRPRWRPSPSTGRCGRRRWIISATRRRCAPTDG